MLQLIYLVSIQLNPVRQVYNLIFTTEKTKPQLSVLQCTHSYIYVQCTYSYTYDLVRSEFQLWSITLSPQHARPPCPSLSPGVYPSSCPLIRCCYPTILFSAALFFFCLQTFLASGSFPVSRPFASGGQTLGGISSISIVAYIFVFCTACILSN